MKILIGESKSVLATLPSESVNTIITSPPYFGLRDYQTGKWEGGNPECPHLRMSKQSALTITGHKNFVEMSGVGDALQKSVCKYCGAKRIDQQIGLEETPEEYVQKLVEVFREARRVLRDDGTLFLNIGDSYSSIGTGQYKDGAKRKKTHGMKLEKEKSGLPSKNLLGIPWRVAFALQADGWILRQDIIWHKPNPMPESVTDRCTKAHEYIFLFAKKPKYYFNNKAIKEPCSDVSKKRAEYGWDCDRPSTKNNALGNKGGIHTEKMGNRFVPKDGKNKRDVWTVSTRSYKGAHFAVFPPELIRPCVLAGCPIGGTVLDTFAGSGTTLMVAKEEGRDGIGIELNENYKKLIEERLK